MYQKREKSFDLSAGCFLICNQWRRVCLRFTQTAVDCLRFCTIKKNAGISLLMQHKAQLISAVWTDTSITAPSLCGEIPPNDGGMLDECWLHVSSKTTLKNPPQWPINNRNIYETSWARAMATRPNKFVIRHTFESPHLQNINACLASYVLMCIITNTRCAERTLCFDNKAQMKKTHASLTQTSMWLTDQFLGSDKRRNFFSIFLTIL